VTEAAAPRAGGEAALPVMVRREVLDDIAAHAGAESPNECCGLLLGTASTIEASHRARNELASPRRYRVQPEDHFAAIRAARARGFDVVGAYHSHPGAPPIPSTTDLQEGVPGPFLYLIAGTHDGGHRTIGAWRLSDGNFVAVRLVTIQ